MSSAEPLPEQIKKLPKSVAMQRKIIERYASKQKLPTEPFVLVSEFSRRVAHDLDDALRQWKDLDKTSDDAQDHADRLIERFLARPHEVLLNDVAHLDDHYAAAVELVEYTQRQIAEYKGTGAAWRLTDSQHQRRASLVARNAYCHALLRSLKLAKSRRGRFLESKFAAASADEQATDAERMLYQLRWVCTECLKTQSVNPLLQNQELLDSIRAYATAKAVALAERVPAVIWGDDIEEAQ